MTIEIEVEGSTGSEGREGEGEIENVEMKEGDSYVVKKGVRHRPFGNMARVVIIEQKGVRDGSGGLAKSVDME